MKKEEFYDVLNSLIEELTIDYAQKLRGHAEEILKQVESELLSSEEINEFLSQQEKVFIEKLESVIDDLEDKIQKITETDEEIKKGVISKLKTSFSRVFNSITKRLSKFVK